jgi:hypothetical protein
VIAQTAADMALLTSRGINSFKFFMAYKVGAGGAEGVGVVVVVVLAWCLG